MADKLTLRDQGTGGKDPEDYPSDARPARVGNAPLPVDENNGRLPAGVAPSLRAIEKRKRIKEMAEAATASKHRAIEDDNPKQKTDRTRPAARRIRIRRSVNRLPVIHLKDRQPPAAGLA